MKKILIGIVIVMLVASGGYFVWKGKQNIVQNKSSSLQASIINEESTTTAIFTGYYFSAKGVYGEEDTGPYDCNTFVVAKEKNNQDPLFRYFMDLIQRANTVNKSTDNQDLILNINLDNLSLMNVKQITASTKEHPIALKVQKKVQWGQGAPPCYSFVDIIQFIPLEDQR